MTLQNSPDEEKKQDQRSEQKTDRIVELGSSVVTNRHGTIHCLTIIGQIEGHTNAPDNAKTTKYEHLLPLLASLEESDEVDGVLILLNTVGGDVEAGLALAEMIAGMTKPTATLVLGGGHSIGIPLAVSGRINMIAPSASMTVHPVRMSGTMIAAPQTYRYFDKLQESIVRFVAAHSQQGQAVSLRQHFVVRMGRCALGVNMPLEQGVTVPVDGQVNVSRGGIRGAQADAPVFPVEIPGVEQGHAPGVDISGFCHHHDPSCAPVQAVHPVVLVAVKIVGHGPGHGHRLLGQGGAVYGDACGLIEDQQVLILPQDGEGKIHRVQIGVVAGRIGHIRCKPVAGMAQGGHGHRYAVEGNAALTPFDGLEQGGGQGKMPAQQEFYRSAVLLGGDNVRKDSHKSEPPGVDFFAQI